MNQDNDYFYPRRTDSGPSVLRRSRLHLGEPARRRLWTIAGECALWTCFLGLLGAFGASFVGVIWASVQMIRWAFGH